MFMENSNIIDAVVIPEKIIYQNENWYILLAFNIDTKEIIIIKGEAPDLKLGFTHRLIGEREINDKYGEQYNITLLIPYTKLESKEDIKNFLLYFLTQKTVDNLFEVFDNPLKVIQDEDVDKLCTVKGIGEYTARLIIQKYKENEIYMQAYVELGRYGLTQNMIKKIINKYKSVNVALERLKNNPYELVDIKYIGWAKADEVAQKLGFGLLSIERLCGFIKYYLREQALVGNSWVNPNQLIDAIIEMYGKSGITITSDNKQEILTLIKDALNQLKNDKIIYLNNDKTFICLTKYYNLEAKVANELLRLMNAKSSFEMEDVDQVIEEIEKEKGYKLTNDQLEAIKLAFDNNVIIISGFSGVGKSTSVEGILKIFRKHSFAQCALSGKASSNLKEITGQDGQTIHRLLCYQPGIGFQYNKHNPLPYDIIIVDEISMVGGELFLSLLEAIKSGSKLIMIGDHHQLPSIGVMNLLQDMLDNNFIPRKILTQIHRQAEKSAIITESMKVKDGIQIANSTGISVRGELNDLVLDIYSSRNQNCNVDEITADKIIFYFKNIYNKVQDINKIQIVVPMRIRGESSAFSISNKIQDIYNPKTIDTKYITLKRNGKNFEIRVGDKIINRKNNYRAITTNGKEISIFNGYIGIVKDINTKEREIIVDFSKYDIDDVIIFGEQLNDIELAYAITCHSFQGSQNDIVIVGLDNYAYMLLSREWVYTAMTRPRKYCIFVAQLEALKDAISKSAISHKQTFLSQFLGENIELLDTYIDEFADEDEEYIIFD